MRIERIAGLSFALLLVAGCGFGGKKSSSEGTGAGTVGRTFVVSASRPEGGTIRSEDGLLQCGPVNSGIDDCSVAFPWTTKVALTATPDPGYFFATWAGDCSDTDPCTFDMVANPGADKWVVAVFNPLERIGHGNWLEPARHARGYYRFLAGDSTAPKCSTCHRYDYEGQGIAPSCNKCHQDAGWTNWQTNCTFCHGARKPSGGVVADAAPPDSVQGRLTGVQGRSVGAHASHVAGTHLGRAFACEECHDHTTSPTDHVDGSAGPTFGPVDGGSLARTDGTTPTWNDPAATCTTYCHGATLAGGGMKAPAWGQLDGTAIACNACHGAPPQSAFHPKGTACGECHLGYTPSTVDPVLHVDGKKDVVSQACGSCHAMPPTRNGHTTSDACGACHPGYTAAVANGDIHVDGIVQVEITGESCGLCHGAPPIAPHPQRSTCGMCHDGYTATTVNATDHRNGSVNVLPLNCTSCHGSGDAALLANAAPPKGVNGETLITDRAVGAHQAHLTGITSTGLTVTGPIACAACHVVPTQVPVDLSHVGAGRAAVTLGAGLGSYDANALNCTTSCHGSNLPGGIAADKLAAWTSAMRGCTSCHGFPPATTAHAGVSGSATACANCHSTVVSGTGAILFTDGVSKHVNGQVDEDVSHGNNGCTSCHPYDMTSPTTYQHVVTDALVASGLTQYPARAAGAPVDGADRTCVMCHADHNLFSPDVNTSAGIDKGFNLRSSFTVAPPQIANGSTASVPPGSATIASADTALCTSCHANVQTKASGQKPDGTTVTPKVPATEFAASGHSYTVNGSFGPSGINDFTVNCTKCHSSPATATRYQDGGARFALHESKDRRLLNPMGMTEADNLEEKSCYRCHSTQGQVTPGGGAAKPVAGYDYFGATTMVTSSEGVYSQMLLAAPTGSAHFAGNYAGLHKPAEDNLQWIADNRHVECADCHDPHQTQRGGQSEEWACSGFNGTAIVTLTDASQKWIPNAFVGYVIEFYVANGSTAPVRGHITANGATSLTFTSASPTSAVNRCRIAMRNNAGTVTSNSAAGSSTLTSTNFTWGSNAFKDWTVRIVAGAGAGQSFKIVSNTTNTLTIDKTWTQALSTTTPSSKYVITRLSNTMTGAEGVDVSQWGSTWAATNTFSPAANTTSALPVAVAQWQVCFKCHSTANAKLLDSTSTWYSAQWTNVAQDFNPNNASTHPVVAPINAGANPATLLAQARLTNGWKPGDVMSCTDCHGTSDSTVTAAQGPHASAVKFILRGPGTRWPTRVGGQRWTYGTRTSETGSNGMFCLNCHALGTGDYHGKHGNTACTVCHLLVPHGGKLKRLARTTNTPAPYADTGVASGLRAYTGGTSSTTSCSASCSSSHGNFAANATNSW